MPDKLLIGNFPLGLETDRPPFAIANESFPVLQNMYVWRGRLKKKRGTSLFGRLQRAFADTQTFTLSTQANGSSYTKTDILADSAVNLRTLNPHGAIVPGTLHVAVGAITYSDPGTGILTGSGSNTGTINYATGALSLSFNPALGIATNVVVYFTYYPNLPVMGLEDFDSNTQSTAPLFVPPQLVAFDTVYSYQVTQGNTNTFFDVSFYKGSGAPVTWSGQDYQQFWSCNYYNALWVTNSKPGFNFVKVHAVTNQTSATITMTLYSGGIPYTNLVVGDALWFNEGTAVTSWTINGQPGHVTDATGSAGGVYVITFASSQTVNGYNADTAIAQTLTRSISGSGDGIRWYDGNNGSPPVGATLGWVNFAPPTSNALKPQYIIGASVIIPFKDRLIMFGYYLGDSSGNVTYYEDGAIWSWNGTPFYTTPVPSGVSSIYAGDPFDITAWYQTPGKGGFLLAGIQQEIITVCNNQDVLIVGFENRQTRFVYTLNDLDPFIFYSINSEMGSESQFSGVTLDHGAVTIGQYGILITNQFSTQRIDIPIPDNVFNIQSGNNGTDRVNALRDFRNEWIYFSYPSNDSIFKFPTETLLWNYRDNTWSILYENFTHHGQVFVTQAYTWGNNPYVDWGSTNDLWGSGETGVYFPTILGGTQQGFVLALDKGSAEAQSAYISNVVGSGTSTIITSPDHCLYVGAFVFITGCLGSTNINNLVGQVLTTPDANTFSVDIGNVTGTYLGGGTYSILNQYFAQTKQFQPYWEQGRKVRIGAQKYLIDKVPNGQTTVFIYLSENAANASNDPLVPNPAVIYSSTVLTSSEPIYGTSTDSNPAGTPNPSQQNQAQIWHRQSTSLLGDTVQIGFTLSTAQLKTVVTDTSNNTRPIIADADFVLHAISTDISPSGVLAF